MCELTLVLSGLVEFLVPGHKVTQNILILLAKLQTSYVFYLHAKDCDYANNKNLANAKISGKDKKIIVKK